MHQKLAIRPTLVRAVRAWGVVAGAIGAIGALGASGLSGPVGTSAASAADRRSISEAITVELVNVEVRVLDNHGQPVSGLPREAFRLLEDGRAVEISHFAWVPANGATGQAATPKQAGPSAATAPVHLMVLFDELQTGERSRKNLVDALRSRLATSLGDDDQVTVLRFDGADLELLLDRSADRRRLGAALDQLSAFSARRLLTANDVRSSFQLLADDIATASCLHTGELLRMYADTVLTQVTSSAAAVLRAAHRFGADDGRKVLLHVSDGIPMMAGGEAYEYALEMCDGTAMTKGVRGAFDVAFDGADQISVRDRFDPHKTRLEFSEYSTAELWTDVAARINTLGVTIYTVQAGAGDSRFLPEIEDGKASATARAFARENPRQTLAFLARETGGLMIDAAGNETAGMDRVAADLGGFYSLAFAPTPRGRSGARGIRVEVDRPGLELRHRLSYRLQTVHEQIAGQLLVLFDAGQLENPLGLKLDVESVPEEPAPHRTARLTVPLESLVLVEDGSGARTGRLTLFLTVRKQGGAIVPIRQRTVDVSLPLVQDGTAPDHYTYAVVLPNSAAEVGAALLDEYSGKTAYVRGPAGG